MTDQSENNSKLIVFLGTGASDCLPFLKLLTFCSAGVISLFTCHHDMVTDAIAVEGHTVILNEMNDQSEFENRLRTGQERLLIVAGYPFNDRLMNSTIAEAIEAGLRMLVLDPNIQNKYLAETLKIANIKHKVRIENLAFGNWDEDSLNLLSGILKDECRRVGI